MDRAPGPSARLKLTLSYAGFLMLAGLLMLAAVWAVVLRYIPNGLLYHLHPSWWFVIDRSDPLHGFASIAGIVLAFLGSAYSYALRRSEAAYFDTLDVFIALMLVGRFLQERAVERNRAWLLMAGGVYDIIRIVALDAAITT